MYLDTRKEIRGITTVRIIRKGDKKVQIAICDDNLSDIEVIKKYCEE